MAKEKMIQRSFMVTAAEKAIIERAKNIEGAVGAKVYDKSILRYCGKIVAEHCRAIVGKAEK